MNTRNTRTRLWLRTAALIGLMGCGFTQVHANTIYSQDATLSHFTSTITEYGTFTSGLYSGATQHTLSPTSTYTPSTSTFATANYPRVIGHINNPVNVSFSSATNSIVVFDNIDHPGNAWDVFQYQIFGSTDGSNYTLLFDPITVNEVGNPNNGALTLQTYTGTAPALLNNTLTPGPGSNHGDVGYEEYFTFSSS